MPLRPSKDAARDRILRIGRCLSLSILVLSLSFVTACQPDGKASETPIDAWVEIRGQRVAVEIADTPEEQALGLGDRDELAWGHGMYFPYEQPAFYAFWMKGMRFPIDIVWILDGHIIQIDSNVPFEPGGNGPTMRTKSLVDGVLEVPAGYAAALGWRGGDRLIMEPDPPDR